MKIEVFGQMSWVSSHPPSPVPPPPPAAYQLTYGGLILAARLWASRPVQRTCVRRIFDSGRSVDRLILKSAYIIAQWTTGMSLITITEAYRTADKYYTCSPLNPRPLNGILQCLVITP
ncbi:hypothetical protein BaRGS_00022646 [Batillaria attramentaria]|uniref:Uncharacterized protein n=1 Tax=Batillaria attramentaria TaxID=370345 RepID=A0ABD0KGM5_9CAEN